MNFAGKGGCCYNCDGKGHIARECQVKLGGCYNCGGPGHIARDCQEKSNAGGGGNNNEGYGTRDGGCYNCGQHGHRARDCQEKNNATAGANSNNGGYVTLCDVFVITESWPIELGSALQRKVLMAKAKVVITGDFGHFAIDM
ncbi:hypothetical protein IFM89_011664 [Coptis chinensis]|uniref:CCHC-type domain-containing protein n=1 Tax=Coptis chinensis TaxID=261450 RepID=A0A835HUF6_9MAGN|nr:hypothetical protein IFM89_011664 [Coptis chinensis]